MRSRLFVLALAGWLCACLTIVGVARAALPPGYSEAVLQIQINDAAANEMVVALRDAGNNIWLDEDDFARLRLRTPDRDPLIVDGVRHFRLQAVAGVSIVIDEATQRVVLTVPAGAFVNSS